MANDWGIGEAPSAADIEAALDARGLVEVRVPRFSGLRGSFDEYLIVPLCRFGLNHPIDPDSPVDMETESCYDCRTAVARPREERRLMTCWRCGNKQVFEYLGRLGMLTYVRCRACHADIGLTDEQFTDAFSPATDPYELGEEYD